MKKIDNYTLLNEETLLSTGNGYVGMRANFEEGYKNEYNSYIGTYINGFYDIHPICYGEYCYGFPQSGQRMVNVHNAQNVWINIDGSTFNIFEGKLKEISRELNIKKGYALRHVKWQSPKGHNFEITFKRMASFTTLELITIDIEIKSVDYDGEIKIVSAIEKEVINNLDQNDSRAGGHGSPMLKLIDKKVSGNVHMLLSETTVSKLRLATACAYNMHMNFEAIENGTVATTTEYIKKGDTVRFTKYIAFADSIRHNDVVNSAINAAYKAKVMGVDYYYVQQAKYLEEFWKYAYITVDDKDVEYALNYSVYQLLSSAGKDEYSNIGAKGLSGGGYEGHYFWDTEIYMIPFFMLTMPKIAKNLLKFRYKMLNASRKRAIEMGHKKGAKIPWRTIAGGECSAYFPAGSAQYHINADIAYAYIQYYLYTNDIEMLASFGFEVIFETARIWTEMGNYNLQGEFCINTVTGPDEYTAIVDNNYYTNSMAKYHLEWTVKLAEILKDLEPHAWGQLSKRLDLKDSELNAMKNAAKHMRLPYDEKLNIHLQDDSFINKKEWDFDNTPKDNYPLLLNYHPLHIYRHQVLKQADTILSYILLDDVQKDIMKSSYDYYKARTTHDSSLSPCVHSMMSAKLNRSEEAYKFFMSTIRLDIDDINKNTKDGLHIANAGGAYMAMIYGFAGLRIKHDGLHINPIKPQDWSGYSFQLCYQNQMIKIEVANQIKITCQHPVTLFVSGEKHVIQKELIL